MLYHMEIAIVIVHQLPHHPVSGSTITFCTRVCQAPRWLSFSERNLQLQGSWISVLLVSTPSCLCRVNIFWIFQGHICILLDVKNPIKVLRRWVFLWIPALARPGDCQWGIKWWQHSTKPYYGYAKVTYKHAHKQNSMLSP